MCHSILITGYGRSGTAFLANALNKSKQWSVFHEPRGNADDLGRKMKVDMRLEEESRETIFRETKYYGEVNSYLRYWTFIHDHPNKFLLLRNPLDIFLSVCNRKDISLWDFYLRDIESWYKVFLRWKDYDGWEVIYFDQITTNIDYLNSIIKQTGITDLTLKSKILNNKVNTNRTIRYSNITRLSYKWQRLAENRLEQFEDI